MSSWIEMPADGRPGSDFSLSNLPFGVYSIGGNNKRSCCTRIGNSVVDLALLQQAGLFAAIPGLRATAFQQETLNSFLEHDMTVWLAVRQRLKDLLTTQGGSSDLSSNEHLKSLAIHTIADSMQFHLPISIGDYTDFYSSREHATNVGTMFRGAENALQPNWLHLPVGYHGRSSTVVASGTPIRRPCGQLQKDGADPKQGSIYGPCKLLDFELELAAVVGGPSNELGTPLTMAQAKDRLFGFMLMNDWSARDVQKWEYVPLGPFTAKNFATTVSPWIVTTAALEEGGFVAPTSAGSQSAPVPLPYLQDPDYSSYDIQLTVGIQSSTASSPTTVSTSNFTNLYWNAAQQLAHHSVTGCVLRAGDLLGSGTISGTSPTSFGSMLELSWKGSKLVDIGNGETRKFLQDGDTVVMNGICRKEGDAIIGFGECTGKILPATPFDAVQQALRPPATASTPPRYTNLKLYSYWRSSCSWRVRIGLAALGVTDYELESLNILSGETKTPEYLAKNPAGQVPTLQLTDTATNETVYMSQSLAILEFLDAIFQGNPGAARLFPSDPMERSVATEMMQVINAGIQPLQNIVYLNNLEAQSNGTIKATEQAKIANEKGLKALEAMVARHSNGKSPPFCLPSAVAPTAVEACLVPQLYNARRYGVDVDTVCPTLVKVEARCLEHVWFASTHPSTQPDAPKQQE